MTDITEWLRQQSVIQFNHKYAGRLDEAADEIDQLRARIAGLEEQHHRDSVELRELCQQRDSARHACELLKSDNAAYIDDLRGIIKARTADLESALERIAELEAQRVPDVLTAKIAERDRVLMRLVDLSNNDRATIEQMRGVAQDARRVLELGSAAPNFTEGANWDAQAYASMRDEIEYWKRRTAQSDEALERISNDLSPTHMGEPVIAAPAPSAPAEVEGEREMFEAEFPLPENTGIEWYPNRRQYLTRIPMWKDFAKGRTDAFEGWKARAQLGAVPSDIGVPISDVVSDALLNLAHDNYERSYSGSKNREADIGLIRAALTATGGRDELDAAHWRAFISWWDAENVQLTERIDADSDRQFITNEELIERLAAAQPALSQGEDA